jgi:predicted nucleic acid-binding protein
MRLYIDLSCFNRPFDNQSQERIRRETQAVFDVLRRIVEGSDSLVWSWVLSFENDKHPKPDRRDEIAVWETRSERLIAVNTDLEERTRQIARQGIPALDAAHLASAEAGGAEIMLTCDDVVLRRAPRLGLALRVLNPVAYLSEVAAHG